MSVLKWKSKTRVTSSSPQVTSSNSRVTSSNPQVTSSNPQGVLSLPSLKRGCSCIYSNLHKTQAFNFLKRISYTNVCLKFLCDAKLIMPLLIL